MSDLNSIEQSSSPGDMYSALSLSTRAWDRSIIESREHYLVSYLVGRVDG